MSDICAYSSQIGCLYLITHIVPSIDVIRLDDDICVVCFCYSNASEKARMQASAREKLAARRRNAQQKRGDTASELRDEEQERATQEARQAEESGGAQEEVTLAAAVLTEVELKQERERNKMADLLNEAGALATLQTWIHNMKPDVSCLLLN